jgi:hypothetical protein
MRLIALALGSALLLASPMAAADSPAPPPPPAPVAPAASPAPSGLVVLARAGATDAAWPLALAVYGNASLRPGVLDDASARVLCGEAPPAGASRALLDLAENVASVHGDDAPSRAVLDAVARHFAVRAVVVVTAASEAGAQPSARVYLTDAGAFDAATYAPDPGATSWTAAAQSLARSYAPVAPAMDAAPTHLPALATHPAPPPPAHRPENKAFWQSAWFWGAVGGAVFAGGAIYFATRDNTGSTIHLEVQVPH